MAHLGASWNRLAASPKPLAASWGASSGDLESKKRIPFRIPFFGSIFGRFLRRSAMTEKQQLIEIPLVLQSFKENRHLEINIVFWIDS